MSAGTKRNTLFQEAYRRLRNVSPLLPWEESVPHMNEFSNILRISGYITRYCFNIIRGAILRMKEVRKKVAEGEQECQYKTGKSYQKQKVEKVVMQHPPCSSRE